MEEMSREQAVAQWVGTNPDHTEAQLDYVHVLMDRVMLRGDDVLVYQIPGGPVRLVSYGSNHALIRRVLYEDYPKILPDTPGENNYRYELKGVVRGTDRPGS